jgi:steroid 5-alpha reductase family enzyme
VAGLVSVWGLRLAVHILWRSRGRGEDPRYGEMRERYGARFTWLSLFVVFWLQAAIMWAVSLTLYQAQRTPAPSAPTWIDGLAVLVFTTGFFFESVGDWQLARFKSEPENRGKLLTTGLWRYTRHPNYFGDALVWWGFFLFALATPGSLWTIYSPVLMTYLLMRVSGVALLERSLSRTKPGYEAYAERTNAFFPWFPR